MKRGMSWLGLGLILGFLLCLSINFYLPAVRIEPVFSPEDGNRVIELIDSAQKSVDIEVYVFTSRDVVEALERAKYRGVIVRVIMEKRVMSYQNTQMYDELEAKGFAVKFASTIFDLTHSKFIIIDEKIVLVGSHNLSFSALYENREASVIIFDEKIAEKFRDIFEQDWIIGY